MSRNNGLDRRAFLKNAGMTALVGVVSGSPPAVTTAAGSVLGPPVGKYDFDTVYNRVGTHCVKWDQQIRTYGKDNIAVGMGIADMDFKAAPAITKALLERIQHENWGYLDLPGSYAESILNWNKRRYRVEINPDLMMHSTGVHPALISALRAFSPPGSKVLVQSPTYNAFYTDITLVGCKAEENPLKLVGGRYSMDFEDLERRISHDTNTLILCNPQNPTGNCWSRDDLATLGEICLRRRVVVLADEIHCDFVNKAHTYTPFSTLDNEEVVRNSITFKAASKSFNLAATKVAYMFSTNADYMARVKATGHRQELNTLGVVASQAAYNEGEEWLDQVVAYIEGNHDFVEKFVSANMPLAKVTKPQGTYLAWLDVTSLADKIDAQRLAADANKSRSPQTAAVTPETMVERFFVKHAKVQMNQGASYGYGGAGHMRMNIATSRKLVETALTNMANACKNV
ncbi:MAG: PatB family C-S lyase [Acidobacteria bacterium]|nr:PatB family C-S lyase [Acidobacteriota bacterium]